MLNFSLHDALADSSLPRPSGCCSDSRVYATLFTLKVANQALGKSHIMVNSPILHLGRWSVEPLPKPLASPYMQAHAWAAHDTISCTVYIHVAHHITARALVCTALHAGPPLTTPNNTVAAAFANAWSAWHAPCRPSIGKGSGSLSQAGVRVERNMRTQG